MLIPYHKVEYHREFHSLFLNFSHIVKETFFWLQLKIASFSLLFLTSYI